ncbi:MAG TPA: hypothetical protein VKX39_00385 [Bryobacteraceae bacterium]|jgi:hypothetical protein|nr:hypothetical protein [Bryobacteraceae bacterium]
MTHLEEEQLVLYYYGELETADLEKHLGECESCRRAYQNLQRVLNSVDGFPVPERPADYESRVWSALQHHLPRARPRMKWLAWKPLAAAAAMAGLMAAAFFAGQFSKKPQTVAADPRARERVLLVAVGDHLERSQMVLIELANAGAPKDGSLDISYQQRAAEDLVESNRLYRTTAANAGDVATASLLDELERVLLEIAHSPSRVSGRQLDELRKEIEDRGILFKVKVFGQQVEQREAAPENAATL